MADTRIVPTILGKGEIKMNKEEILEKSRKQNEGNDEMVEQSVAKAGKSAMIVGLAAGLTIQLLNIVNPVISSLEAWLILSAVLTVYFFERFKALHRKYELVFGIISAVTLAVNVILLGFKMAGM